jgi:hypothetical protein
MSPSRPSLRVRPRSAIADAELARTAVTELPATRFPWRDLRPGSLLRLVRTLGRPMEPERVIVMTPARVRAGSLRRRG